MNRRRVIILAALLCAGLALFLTLPVGADCPPQDPDCPLIPPDTIEVNPNPRTADGSPVEVPMPGRLTPVEIVIPMPSPNFVDPAPFPFRGMPTMETLPVPMRYQDPEDTTCGVHALGMALEGLGGPAPSSPALESFLRDRGMMYEFGTGVEELAFAAQSAGYKGSIPFHDWTFNQLASEVEAGRPVVVSLGSNGADQPGHFVTVTGVSDDGEWVAYNDPALGKRVVSREEFSRLWALEGNSGVSVRREAPPTSDGSDPTAWVAVAAALMAAASQSGLGWLRTGIGGRLSRGSRGRSRPRPAPRPRSRPRPAPRPRPRPAPRPRPRPRPTPRPRPAPRRVPPRPAPHPPKPPRRVVPRPRPAISRPSLPPRPRVQAAASPPTTRNWPVRAAARGATAIRNFASAEAQAGLVSGAAGNLISRGRSGLEAAKRGLQTLKSGARTAARGVRRGITSLVNGARGLATNLWNGIKGAAGAVGRVAVKGVRGIRNLPNLARDAAKDLSNRIKNLPNAIRRGAASVVGTARNVASRVRGGLGTLWQGIKNTGNAVKRAGEGALNWVRGLPGRVSARASGLWTGIKNAGNALKRCGASALNWVRGIPGRVSGAGSSLLNGITRAGGRLKNIGSGLWNGLTSLPGRIRGGISSVWQGLGNAASRVRTGARNLWQGLTQRVQAIRKPPTNPRFQARASAAAGGGALLSLIGNIGYGATGSQAWRDAAGVGDVITGSANLVGLRGTVANARTLMGGGARVMNTVSKIGRFTGVLSAVTGGYTAFSKGIEAYQIIKTEGFNERAGIAIAESASGAMAAIGGGLLLTPAAPIGGVLLAVSSIVTAGTWVYQNRHRIAEGLKAVGGAVKNVATAVGAIARRAAEKVGQAASTIASTVGNAISGVKDFFGNLFSGKG